MRKYCCPSRNQALQLNDIRTVGWQVLKALEFLHDKGLSLGNLHTGNIVLTNETAKIINMTGVAGGQSSRVRALAVKVKVSEACLTSF